MKLLRTFGICAALCSSALAADKVYSGPQTGEKITPFKVLEAGPGSEGKERDPVTENKGAPTAYVFVHTIERSLLPLLRAIDTYGDSQKEKLKTETVFLFGDRLEGEQRLKGALNSIRLKSRTSLSPDGAEGPGNFGLNKECMMTVVAASNNVVTANFALVQPGISDAEAVIKALAKLSGDPNPPSADQILAASAPRGRMNENPRMQERVQRAGQPPAGEPFPGAVPTDPRLNQLVRQFIRPENDKAAIDKLRADIEAHIKDKPELQTQARAGWERILHFGDHYGTEYSRENAKQMMESLPKPAATPKE